MPRGRPTKQSQVDRLGLREACQAFEMTYNHIEKLLSDFSSNEVKDNMTQIAFYIGKLGSLYQKIVEKSHVFDDVVDE